MLQRAGKPAITVLLLSSYCKRLRQADPGGKSGGRPALLPQGYPIEVAVTQSEKSNIFMNIIKMLDFSLVWDKLHPSTESTPGSRSSWQRIPAW